MIKPIVFLCQGLVVNVVLLLTWSTSVLAQNSGRTDVDLKDINSSTVSNVQWYRSGGWNHAHAGVLDPENWLATGSGIAQATMWYHSIAVLYRQVEDTLSQFMQVERCGFHVHSGKILYADVGTLPDGCREITLETAETELNTPPPRPDFSVASQDIQNIGIGNPAVVLFVFRNRDAEETTVGILASQRGPVQVINTISNREDSLTAGEFAVLSSDGNLVKERFSLRDFYENNPLTLGLGLAPEDEDYVAEIAEVGIEEEIRLLGAVREATLEALREQPEPGPFAVRRLGESNLAEVRTLSDLPSFPCLDYPGYSDVTSFDYGYSD